MRIRELKYKILLGILALCLFAVLLPLGVFAQNGGAAQSFSFTVDTTRDGTDTTDVTFSIPLSGGSGTDTDYNNNNNFGKPYNWSIDWGDGSAAQIISNIDSGAPQNAVDSAGIEHNYSSSGTYTITITNNASSNDAWLAAFGFSNIFNGANVGTNKEKVVAINSAITPEMTRTANQITGTSTAPNFEWAYAFSNCKRLKNTGAGFTSGWGAVKTIGDHFASSMFRECNSLTSTGDDFNLPQSPVLASIGDYFADSMFYSCTSLASMGDDFNLPQSPVLASIGSNFANSMFHQCEVLSSMGDKLTLPQSPALASIGNGFAYSMFHNCKALASIKDNFNLPQSTVLTTIGNSFANAMFSGCTSLASMGENFNLPQSDKLTTIGDNLASYMFLNAGNNLIVNDVFRFPTLTQTQINQTGMFYYVFLNTGLAQNQNRSAQSIINGNPVPYEPRETFINQSAAFSDFNILPTNWGDNASPTTDIWTVTFANNTTQGVNPTYMPPAQGVIKNSTMGKPATPEATNFIFIDWYTDDLLTKPYDYSQPVTESFTLYAGWGYKVAFETNGGTAVDTQTVISGRAPSVPTTPTKQGMVFVGWYKDAALTNPYNFDTALNESVTLYASWATPNYGISLTPAVDHTFTPAVVGYGEQQGHGIIVTNTGNQPTGQLTITLSGTNKGNFNTDTTTITSISTTDDTATFFVRPNVGLAAGTYTATVTVSGQNNISQSFNISFTVTPTSSTPATTTMLAPQTGVYGQTECVIQKSTYGCRD